jgi:uncharacterized protein (TIGR03437 family)
MGILRFWLAFLLSSWVYAYGATQWADLGGNVGGKPAVAKNADGRLTAFARWQDGSVHSNVQSAAGSTQWSGWSSLSGKIVTDPVAGVNKDGRLDIFGIGPDNAIWHATQSSPGSATFGAWTSLGGQGLGDPFVIANADGRLEVFINTTNGSMWHVWQTSPGGTWSKGDEIVGEVMRPPSAGLNSDGRVVVFVGDSDGKDWWIIENATGADSWSPWWCLLGGTVTAPLVGRNVNGTLELFAVRSDGSVWTSTQTSPGSYNYTDWLPLGGNVSGDPAIAANQDGRLELFGRGADSGLWHASQTNSGGPWSSWGSLGGTIANSPAVALDSNGMLQVFAQSPTGTVLTIGQSSPGSWAAPSGTLPSISSSNSAVPVWNGSSNISSNMFASIYGSNLASVTQSWDNAFDGSKAPTSLGGVSVTVNGVPAFVQYVSPTQINIDAPDDSATGPVTIVVHNAVGASNSGASVRSRLSPTFLSDSRFVSGSKSYVVAQTPDFTKFIGPAGLVTGATFVSARPGDTVIIFATGCGPTNPATFAGTLAAQNSPLALPYQVMIGGQAAIVTFAGMVKGTVGLYQFNVVVPAIAAGDQPIALAVDGVANAQGLWITVGSQ